MTTIREYIDTVKALNEDDRPAGWNKPAPELRVREQKQIILDGLDRLLGIQTEKHEKAAALREIAQIAKRMADNIERWSRDQAEDGFS